MSISHIPTITPTIRYKYQLYCITPTVTYPPKKVGQKGDGHSIGRLSVPLSQAEHHRLLGGSCPAEQAAGGCEAGTGRGQRAGGAASASAAARLRMMSG